MRHAVRATGLLSHVLVAAGALAQPPAGDAPGDGGSGGAAAAARAPSLRAGALAHLRDLAPARARDPRAGPALTLRVEAAAGYTTNALAGLPLDPGAPGPRSAAGGLTASGRLLAPRLGPATPSLRAAVGSLALAAEDARDLSYLELALQPGLVLGRGAGRVLVAYRLDGVFLRDPGWDPYLLGHRLEGELTLPRGVAVFAGAGHRAFHEPARSRLEVDGGAGVALPTGRRLRLTLVASARYHLADDVAYDLAGATLLAAGRAALPAGLLAEVGLGAGIDHYVSSGEAHGLAVFGIEDKRRDLLARASLALWSPAWRGGRAGAAYALALRDSTADVAPRDFDYREQRAELRLRWTWEGPSATAGEARGAGARDVGAIELYDVLWQAESDRRSSCGCRE